MSHAPHLRRIVLAALAGLAAFIGLASPAQAAQDNFITFPKIKYPAFDVPPNPLPAGKPGDIIRWRTMGFSASQAKPPRGTLGYKFMYLSTSATGQPIAVTAYLLVPHGYIPKQGVAKRPLIGYGNEAMGLGDYCAQSRMLEYAHSGELALIEPMLKRGYAVVASDYEGLGTPSTHTFGVSVSAGHAILDSMRAARQLEAAGLPKDSQNALFGYSQGGQGVGRGLEMASTYAPELKISAAAFGGTPTDPVMFSRWNSGKLFSAVNLAASAGYDAAYPELDLKSFLNERGVKANKATYTACIESVWVVPMRRSSAFLKEGMDPLKDPRWIKRFSENAIGNQPPSKDIPTYYFHAIGDQAVPFQGAKRLRRQYCRAGVNLTFQALAPIEHVATGPIWMPQAAKWVADRLEGKPAKSNCWKNSETLPLEVT